MDFTIKTYKQLLQALQAAGYAFGTLAGVVDRETSGSGSHVSNFKLIILRNDVEARYENALQFASIQNEYDITASYYFRIMNGKLNRAVIEKIAASGHEIGYHYDDLSFCKGDHKAAIKRFEKHLKLLREIAPVRTITMEGAPLSKHDNRKLWDHYDYRDYGIISEPYFDMDFTQFFYLTDTGRRWDGWQMSLRDKVPQQEDWIRQGLVFHSTKDIIKAADEDKLPKQIMMTFHPQRWSDRFVPWVQEAIVQNLKNMGKKMLQQLRNGKAW